MELPVLRDIFAEGFLHRTSNKHELEKLWNLGAGNHLVMINLKKERIKN